MAAPKRMNIFHVLLSFNIMKYQRLLSQIEFIR